MSGVFLECVSQEQWKNEQNKLNNYAWEGESLFGDLRVQVKIR